MIKRNTKKALIINWGIAMILFMGIALVAIGFAFSPATVHIKAGDSEGIFADSALTVQGMQLRADAWEEYPQYNIGFGVIGVLAFLGAVWASRLMYLLKEVEIGMDDVPESKIGSYET